MSTELREELEEYLRLNFTEEMADEYLATLMIFDTFEFTKPYDLFADVLYDYADDDKDIVRQNLISVFDEMVEEVFRLHGIKINPDTSLETKNQILSVLYRLQNIEDPVSILRILESSREDEEKLATIVADFTMLSEEDVLTAVESIDEKTLRGLQTFLYEKEEKIDRSVSEEDLETKSMLFRNLKDFFHVCGQDNIGYEMVQGGLAPGYNSGIYYPHFKDLLLTNDPKQTAKNLLSFFFISKDLFNDPLAVYRKTSERLIFTVEMITKVEVELSILLNNLRQYQKAQNDARRVSVIQHQT